MKKTAKEIRAEMLGRVAAMEKRILAADDAEIESMADQLAADEQAIVSESTGEDAAAAAGGQNERANDNWPIQARREVAARMLKLAAALVAEEDDEDGQSEAE